MGLLNYTVMEQPYTAAEILKNLDDDGQISGVVGISLDDIIENDMEGFDDILTERLVGLNCCLSEISYDVVGVEPDETFCISAYPDMWMMWIILRANAINSFCHLSGLKLNPHSANRKPRAGLMPARFFVRIPKVHARAEMHHERAYLHCFSGRKGFVALLGRKVPRFLGS